MINRFSEGKSRIERQDETACYAYQTDTLSARTSSFSNTYAIFWGLTHLPTNTLKKKPFKPFTVDRIEVVLSPDAKAIGLSFTSSNGKDQASVSFDAVTGTQLMLGLMDMFRFMNFPGEPAITSASAPRPPERIVVLNEFETTAEWIPLAQSLAVTIQSDALPDSIRLAWSREQLDRLLLPILSQGGQPQ